LEVLVIIFVAVPTIRGVKIVLKVAQRLGARIINSLSSKTVIVIWQWPMRVFIVFQPLIAWLSNGSCSYLLLLLICLLSLNVVETGRRSKLGSRAVCSGNVGGWEQRHNCSR